jgi:rod shape-determining protein MreC
MEMLLRRYRNLTVLLIVVVAQLLYLAYQVKTNRDERLIRVWAVSAVTPMAGIVEGIRRNTIGFLEDYFILLDVREQDRKLKADNDKLRMENIYYRNQLSTAEHARALILFQAQSPSKTVAARVIGNSTVATAKAVFIDRGSTSGIEKGMAVVTPEGIVGKVVAVYPLSSQVLLVTDSTFKVGVESRKGHVHGVLSCNAGRCNIEQIQNEEKVEVGEWFFTSGEDRIFPKGFPVGSAVSVEPGQGMKNIKINLSGAPGGVEEVLVILQGVHQSIPPAPLVSEQANVSMPPPPPEPGAANSPKAKPQTEADKIAQKYVDIGAQQGHVYGAIGSNIPDFNSRLAVPASNSSTGPQAQKPNTAAPAIATAASERSPRNDVTKVAPGDALSTAGTSETPKPIGAKSARVAAHANSSSPPILPLGAPRPKPTPAPAPPAASPPNNE